MVMMAVFIALVAVMLIAVVLIQNSKGGGIDSTFGGQANQMLGAARSADFVEKLTWYLAAALFVLCIVSAVFFAGSGAAEAPLLSQ